MKAMILAAGLGTRLKPLTDKIPKALVEVEGVPMLEHVILSLTRQGFDDIIINVHHLSALVREFLDSREYGASISISDETEELLDTGGGIVKAGPLIFRNDDEPVLIHNVDILSDADLNSLMKTSDGKSTLLVSDRESTRKLIFDDHMNLRGWHDLKNDIYQPRDFRPATSDSLYAFSGIYVLDKKAIEEMKTIMGKRRFPVMDYFLSGKRIQPIRGHVAKDLRLIDIGKPATLSQASDFLF